MEKITDPTDQSNDQEWIRQTLAGDSEAFGKLVQKHHPPLYHMARRILKNPQEAEDVVQDGFIEAYRHLAEFKQRSRFSTWVYTIVLNRIRNMLRHSKILHISSLDRRRATRDGHCSIEIMESVPPVEETLQKQFEHETIQQAARALPLQYRDMFMLYYFENFSIAEIAKKVNRPPVTVKVYLHRARKWLSRELQKDSSRLFSSV